MNSNPIKRLAYLADKEVTDFGIDKEYNIIDIYFDLYLQVQREVYNDVFLKVNVLLNKLLPDKARSTKDLDFSCINKNIYDNVIKDKLINFGNTVIKSGLAKSYVIKDISEDCSGGIDVKDSNNKIIYSIDVSLSNINKLNVVDYDLDGNRVRGSSINKIIADKCMSTLSSKRFRRMKDFYDLYIIIDSYINYDPSIVLDIMISKIGIEEVKYLFSNYPFNEDTILKANYSWSKLYLYSFKDSSILYKPDFVTILDKVYYLYNSIECYL